MSSSENLAVAAHLHVLLRRKTGRVTDTEWMATDRAYAAEIVRFARAKALENSEPDLAAWADKLQVAMALPGVPPSASLMDMASRVARQISPEAAGRAAVSGGTTPFQPYTEPDFEPSRHHSEFHDGPDAPKQADPNAPRYVKGLR